MTLRDFSFDIGLAHTDGLAILVDRFQVDQLRTTQERYREKPYLKRHLRQQNGWIDVWPDFVHARLLRISMGHDMCEDGAMQKLRRPIQEQLVTLATRDLPTLEFSGKLHQGSESCFPVWKLKSKPAHWLADLRKNIRDLAEGLHFKVDGLIEPENEVHIIIRGRYPNSGTDPKPPSEESDFQLLFEKLGFRRRYYHDTGKRNEPFGALLAVNLFSTNLADHGLWPSLTTRGQGSNQTSKPYLGAGAVPAEPRIVELHAETTFPLESEEEVAIAASLREADRVAAPRNALVWARLPRTLPVPEPFVLLKFTRDPKRYHEELDSCAELQMCREHMTAAGKKKQLPSGARVFVDPLHYDVGMKAVDLHAGTLTGQHIFASPDYYHDVMGAIRRIPCNAKVRCKKQTIVPSAVALEAVSSGIDLVVRGTFILVSIPSSLCSSASGQSCVASTTEAHAGKNPRRA